MTLEPGWGQAAHVLAEESGVELTPTELKEAVYELISKMRERIPSLRSKSDAEVFNLLVDRIKKTA